MAPPATRRHLPARLVAGFATLALLGATVGCSLRSDDKPRPLPKDAVPKVLSQQNASSTTTRAPDAGTQQRVVYLVHAQGTSEELIAERVSVPSVDASTSPAGVARLVLEQLIGNPPVSDKSALTSAIPPGTTIRSVTQRDDIVEIDLTNLGTIESTGQRLAVAQIVFTATAIEGINGVRFLIDGNPTAVPVDDRSADIGAVVTRDDFPKLRPGATATATTEPTVAPSTDPSDSATR